MKGKRMRLGQHLRLSNVGLGVLVLLAVSLVAPGKVCAQAGDVSPPFIGEEQAVLPPKVIPADLDPAARLALDWPDGMTRVRKQIETVAGETLSESLANLYQLNMWYWPGGPHPEGSFVIHGQELLPLDPAIGESDLHYILSNRRFLRVFQELAQMDRSSAAALVKTSLRTATEEHDALYAEYAKYTAPHYRYETIRTDEHGAVSGGGIVTSTVNETERHVNALRYNVLALTWIAGALGLGECHDLVVDISERAMGHQRQAGDASELHEVYRRNVLKHISLYNRQILAFSLARTSPNASSIEQKLLESGVTETELYAAPFDALLTPYDIPARTRIYEEREGGRTIVCYTDVGDDTFEAVVSVCTSDRN
jgi:hypothetical protein